MKQISFFLFIFIFSCNTATKNNTEPYTKERTTVNPAPVKEYAEEVNDKLNPEWKFKVQLFEQKVKCSNIKKGQV